MNAPEDRHFAAAPPDSSPDATPASTPESTPDAFADVGAVIAALRAAGADRFDPVRLRYIETLAERAGSHRGNVRRLLDAKLAQALATFRERFALAQSDAREVLDRGAKLYPQAARELQRLHATGDFKAMQKLLHGLKPAGQQPALSLGGLARQLEQREPHAPHNPEIHLDGHAGLRPELKTIRNFKNTLSRLSVHKQVAQALEQAPKNAGPINSHMLVLRSLALMRDISPDYLSRFISYADTLLCLDQCETEKTVTSGKLQVAKGGKVTKAAKAAKAAKTSKAAKAEKAASQ